MGDNLPAIEKAPMAPGLYNMDCMEAMKHFPDNFFDLAVVDPPYGDAGMVENSIGGGYGLENGSTGTSSQKLPGGGYGTRARTNPNRRHMGGKIR